MCGIAGIVAPDARRFGDSIVRMVDALRHRGPDGSGTWFSDCCGLGHARLAVVDPLSGDQPMRSRDPVRVITFNGEIYGYKSLRKTLGDYPFRTQSDTEVILALYERNGPNLAANLHGMFAFAIWDDAKRELFCARDRFGEKPFFYAFGIGGEFLFASEIKALIASGRIRPVLSPESVSHYLKRLYVHPHRTIYGNVHVLPPAHTLRLADGRVTVEPYWKLPDLRDRVDPVEAEESLRRLVGAAVERQLVADVPVGAFLSGGLDSSTIVAEACRHRGGVKTFSFEFDDEPAETPFARDVARLYGTDHTELADRSVDIGELLFTMAAVYDEPFADSSNIPTWLIARRAREHVKVVLTGDGGDELLAGYTDWYRPLLGMEEASSRGASCIRMYRVLAMASQRFHWRNASTWSLRLQGAEYLRRYGSISEAHSAQREYFRDAEIGRMGLPRWIGSGPSIRPEKESGTVDDALRMDLTDYLPGDILVKIDRASMAHGLELRAPFLDADLASFCISLPRRLKIGDEGDKLLLRRAFAEAWPPSVRARGKQGFGAPVVKWLVRDTVRALKGKYLDDPGQRLFSLLSFQGTRPAAARGDYGTWILLVLALWMDRHAAEME